MHFGKCRYDALNDWLFISIWACGCLSFIVLASHVVKSAILKLLRPPFSSLLSLGDCLLSHTSDFSFSSGELWVSQAFHRAATYALGRRQKHKMDVTSMPAYLQVCRSVWSHPTQPIEHSFAGGCLLASFSLKDTVLICSSDIPF